MSKNICILFITAFMAAYSQDFEPSQRAFHPDANSSSTFFINADSAKFKARSVIRGWQWGGSRRFTKGVLCHTHDGIEEIKLSSIPYTTFVDSCELFLHPWGYTHAVGPEPLNGRGIQYEPTLLLNANNPDSLIIRQGDTTLPVFGFLMRRGFIPEFGDPNFNRLIIDDSLNGEVILADPWPDYMLGMNGVFPESGSLTQAFSFGQNIIISCDLSSL